MSRFLFFSKKKKTKAKLPMAYESYPGEIVLVFLIENLNGHCFILYQLETMSP